MYIHVDYRNFTKKCGKFINEYVKFDNKDKMNTLYQMIYYIQEYMNEHNIKDLKVTKRCNRIKKLYNEYINNKGPYITWLINDNNVQTGIKMIEYCVNHIEENHIKDRKAINRCWAINCFSGYWRKDFKCQGA